jgi:disulfide bond formation protein DsbB
MADITLTNNFFSVLTVIAQGAIILLMGSFLLHSKKREAGIVLQFFAQNAVLFAFIVALISTLGSLFYSEVVGFDVCKLCWFQRVLMYPQSIILGLALIKKDKKVLDYSIALSIFGILIALYHYLLQLGIAPSVACPIVGYSAGCAGRFVMNFGYITIPMMSVTAFGLITLIGFSRRYLKGDQDASK